MVTDKVGDFIIRLKNAAAISAPEVKVSHSGHLEAIARKLKELGYLTEVRKEGDVKKTLIVTLAYDDRGTPRLRGVDRISKPGRRLYVSARESHGVKDGMGSRILSTPKGVLSDAEARKVRAGGETLFEIW
ncbi:MAG TPA: 30S ribosomal protein S8 [Candidatus Paceibacterota bacterium]|nr:30S ribosomal protein S8 [Candidatus Paceibacterota bacterium]